MDNKSESRLITSTEWKTLISLIQFWKLFNHYLFNSQKPFLTINFLLARPPYEYSVFSRKDYEGLARSGQSLQAKLISNIAYSYIPKSKLRLARRARWQIQKNTCIRHMIKYGLDWTGKTWTGLIKHGMIKHGLIKHGVVKNKRRASHDSCT